MMPSPDTIHANYDSAAEQWVASFAGVPQVACGSPTAAGAARRLLETTEAERGTYALLCDCDRTGGTTSIQFVRWEPPELLRACDDCQGTGEYRGLLESGPCGSCSGRGSVPA